MDYAPLTFGCGRAVTIDSVFVRGAYYGLLEGSYTERVNRMMLEARQADARHVFRCEQPHLVEPVMVPADRGERLPNYCCVAELTSFQPARDPARMCSGAILMWFQENAEPAIGEDIRQAVQGLRWAEVAVDGDW